MRIAIANIINLPTTDPFSFPDACPIQTPLLYYIPFQYSSKSSHKHSDTTIMPLDFSAPCLICQSLGQAANERITQLMPPIAKAAGITEQLKATDQMLGLMNTVKAQVEE